jgi:hypothetical protein
LVRLKLHHENGLDIPQVEFRCVPAGWVRLRVLWHLGALMLHYMPADNAPPSRDAGAN